MTDESFQPFLPPAQHGDGGRPLRGPLTVSQLTAMVKEAVENALPTTVHVIGEISNFKRHTSGHLYFTLKDAHCELSCVMWRSAAADMKFSPTDGLSVVATGVVEVFEAAGRYQLYARKIEPRGVGALELAFRQLCEKLASHGWFSEDRKKPIPRFPSTIAIVTSPTGAAIRDMLQTIERRCPCVAVLVYPVRVQGPGAAVEIADAVRALNRNSEALGGIDVMIVGRGGGSLEDLWSFNEEPVARAIHESRIPVISAVGHEVDVTIADMVADVRAATPTAAAELAVPVLEDLVGSLGRCIHRLRHAMSSTVAMSRTRLDGIRSRRAISDPRLALHRKAQLVDETVYRMTAGLVRRVSLHRRRVDMLSHVVQHISPAPLLARLAARLREAKYALLTSMGRRVVRARSKLEAMEKRCELASPARAIPELRRLVGGLADALGAAAKHHLSLNGERLRAQDGRLRAVGYKSVLRRGYSVTRTKGGTLVRTPDALHDGDRLITEVAEGKFESEVRNLRQLDLFD